MDKLSTLLGRAGWHARVFFNGTFCAATSFAPDGMRGHLHLVRQGPVVFEHAGAPPLHVEEPSMVLYPRGSAHLLRVPDGATAILLCADIAFQGGCNHPVVRMLPDCMAIPLREMAQLGGTLELLFAEAAARAPGSELILDRLCDVLMVQVLRREFEHGKLDTGILAGLVDRQLAPILEAMHARPHEPWRLDTLARLAGMSRASFTEHFRQVVGMPPMEYLTRWRMGLACRLLRDGLPVKTVSVQAGYASPPAFTRAFTEHVGSSPRQWLRERAAAAAAA